MTYKHISDETAVTSLSSTDVFAIDTGSGTATNKVSASQIGTFIGLSYVPYTGATGNVNLGSYGITANSASLQSIQVGTSAQFSIDNTGTVIAGIWHGTAISLTNYASGTLQAAQFPSLAGDVTTSSGSLATTIATNAVTYAKMQAVSTTSKLLGSSSTTTAVQEITVGSGLTLSGTTLSATGGGGSVTSVAVSGANGIGVSGSPITTSGTIALSLGTITGATWNGNTIGIAYGGTNNTSFTSGQVCYFDGTSISTSSNIYSNGALIGIGSATNSIASVNSAPSISSGTTTAIHGFRLAPALKANTAAVIQYGYAQSISADLSTNIGIISNCYSFYIGPGTAHTGTVNNGIGLFVDTLLYGNSRYGGWFGAQSGGSINIPLYADAFSVGFTATPPSNGAIISGSVSVGSSSAPGMFNVGTFAQFRIGSTGIVTNGTWNATAIGLTYGGTGGSTTASNGGIVWSDASQMQILSGTATANKMLLSGASATPSWSTSTIPSSAGATANKVLLSDGTNYVLSTPTFPNASATAGKIIRSDGTNWAASTSTFTDTYAVSTILYAGTANTISGLATANSSILVTNGSGVPALATDIPTAVTIGAAYIYRVGGTDVSIADGGTNAGSQTSTGVCYFNGTSITSGSSFTADSSGRVGIGGALNTAVSLNLTAAYQYGLWVQGTTTSVAGSVIGINTSASISPATSNNAYGVASQPTLVVPSAGTVPIGAAMYAYPILQGSGTFTEVAGFLADTGSVTSGTISTGYGMKINAISYGTTRYGIYVAAQSGGSTNVAAYIAGLSINSSGTVTAGLWQGTAVTEQYGGTGESTYTKGDVLVASGTTSLDKVSVGSNTYVFTADSSLTQGAGWKAPVGYYTAAMFAI